VEVKAAGRAVHDVSELVDRRSCPVLLGARHGSTEVMSAWELRKLIHSRTHHLLMLCRAQMNRQLQVKPKGSVY
jgi:hypothetical protein